MRYFLAFIMVTITLCLHAETTLNAEDNLEKYWYYRYRLINNFMKVGDCAGCSVPVTSRRTNGVLAWGDGTINLGWYISILATEYYLLKMHDQPLDSTKKELYYALKAFNRLDKKAEMYIPATDPAAPNGNLNGFFIRQDPPPGFLGDNYSHFNSDANVTVNRIEENSILPPPSQTAKIPSEGTHDQIWPILMGMRLITALIEPNVSYQGRGFMDGKTNFVEEARQITDRVVNYMRESGDKQWFIQHPENDSCLKGLCDKQEWEDECTGIINVDCGGNARILSYGAAEAACQITGKIFLPKPKPAIPPTRCKKYHNTYSHLVNGPEWQTLVQYGLIFGSSGCLVGDYWCREISKVLMIGSIASPWWEKIITPAGVIRYNTSSEVLGLNAAFAHFEIFPLLHQALYRSSNLIEKENYKILLNTAPCEGPWAKVQNGEYEVPHFQWSTGNRFRAPHHRVHDGDETEGGLPRAADYAGYGYMLLHNLYYIVNRND